MGIYIKGMKMPKNCWECKFEKVSSSHAEGHYCVCVIAGKRIDDGQEDWCPLVSVPPHGDLIDKDALSKSLDELCDRVCQYPKAQRKMMCSYCPLGDAFIVVEDDAPAIIEEDPKERSEDNDRNNHN